MIESVIPLNRTTKCRTKVKTGCSTCRTRKIKCDEGKPFCQRCVNTGRNCDGYEDPFRTFTTPNIKTAHVERLKAEIETQISQPSVFEITTQDVDLLNHYLSTKTLFGVNLGCDEEARQILEASLTDPPIQHAILSLRALREDLEVTGDFPTSITQRTPSHHYGLQQYSMALGGLASNLSIPSFNVLKSALLCCQIFISIEQVRNNFAAMAQHIIRGLGIMHEYKARPGFVLTDKLVQANYDQLPLLDIFIVKLFAAPCKFADPTTTTGVSGRISSACPISFEQNLADSRDLRMIAPNMRTELTRIAASTLEFLDKVSQIESIDTALKLLNEKIALIETLELWHNGLETLQKEIEPPTAETVSVSFLRFFHIVLKVVLLGALDSSTDLHTKLQPGNDRMLKIASAIGERLKTYSMSYGTGSRQQASKA